MTVPTDDRLLDEPMRPVQCLRCNATLRVRKSSWDQTSIQWDATAMDTCVERQAARPAPGPNGAGFETCQALRASIQDAVEADELRSR